MLGGSSLFLMHLETQKMIQVSLSGNSWFFPSVWVIKHPLIGKCCSSCLLLLDASITCSRPPSEEVCQECLLGPALECPCNLLAYIHSQALIPMCQENTRAFFFIFMHLFFCPSHLQMSSYLCHVLTRAKGTVGGLHLFPVWSWWGCCSFGQSSNRK